MSEIAPPRKRADFRVVSHHERAWQAAKEAKQMARAPGDDRKAVRQPALGAAARASADWDQIDWQQCATNVSRLQARIVKAIEAGKWNRARALQRLLTHSFSGRALAVKRVTENKGKRTPGVDGVIWRTPAQKATAVHELRRRGYRAQPLRRLLMLAK